MPEATPTASLVGRLESRRTSPLSESRTLVLRALRLTLRNPEALSTALALPVILMLMFVYLFGGAIHTGTRYVDYVVPGVLLVCVGFGAATTAVSVSHDLNGAIIDRFRSMDVRGEALVNGHVLASVLRNLLSTILVAAVAAAIGFRPHGDPAACAEAIALLGLYVLAISWLAAAIGMAARTPEAAQGITFFVGFLPYPSSAFVPVHTMPSVLRAFASDQPVTAVANAIRALVDGTPAGASPWHALAWSIAITAASIALAGALYRRRAR
jgi:ABC-2 type transport system permease protein